MKPLFKQRTKIQLIFKRTSFFCKNNFQKEEKSAKKKKNSRKVSVIQNKSVPLRPIFKLISLKHYLLIN